MLDHRSAWIYKKGIWNTISHAVKIQDDERAVQATVNSQVKVVHAYAARGLTSTNNCLGKYDSDWSGIGNIVRVTVPAKHLELAYNSQDWSSAQACSDMQRAYRSQASSAPSCPSVMTPTRDRLAEEIWALSNQRKVSERGHWLEHDYRESPLPSWRWLCALSTVDYIPVFANGIKSMTMDKISRHDAVTSLEVILCSPVVLILYWSEFDKIGQRYVSTTSWALWVCRLGGVGLGWRCSEAKSFAGALELDIAYPPSRVFEFASLVGDNCPSAPRVLA